MKPSLILTVFLFFGVQNTCIAQQFNVKTYSFNEGLTTYNIKKALQDKYGFIWLATQDGVYRYDGTNFESYKKSSDGSASIRENFIFDIALGNDENLYIASFPNTGVDVINIRTLKVTPLLSQKKENEDGLPDLWIEKIFCDAENNLWIGGKEYLRVFNLDEKKFKDFQQSVTMRPDNHITFIRSVNKNTIAVGAKDYGILFYNTASLKIQDSIRTLQNINNITVSDLCVKNDSCYFSSGSKLYSGKFFNGTWQQGRTIIVPAISDNIINCITTGRENELWLGTNNGIGKFDLTTNQFKTINNEYFNADNFIGDLFHDKENSLWISSSKNLIRMNLIPSPFYAIKGSKDGTTKMNHIYSLVPVNKTHLFACGTDGLYLFDPVSESVRKIKGTSALGIIHYVYKMNDDLWLVCSDAGMYAYQPSKEILSKDLLIRLFPEWRPFTNNYFNNTVKWGNKTYWASEEQEGLLIWDNDKHEIRQYKSGTAASHGIPENHMHNIKLDKEGFIWMLFDNSVAKYDVAVDSVVKVLKYDPSGKGFNAGIFFDMYDDGSILWFGTYGGGINGYNKKTGEWKYITEDNGLCNNAVYGILPERDSIFWVSTNNGISRVNYKTEKCLNYFVEDGLHDNSFDEKGALLFDKKLFFAGVNGFTSVDLENYYSSSMAFPVYVKKLEYIKGNKRTTLNDLEWNKIKLPAGTSAATISLSAISYTSNRPRFSYKIKGFQDEYLPAGDKNKIELNALSYGEYEIDIRYMNEKGEFVEGIVGIDLEILPFWYQTWWFRMLVIIVALSIIISIVRLIYISRLRKQRAVLEKQLAVQFERQRISAEMHDDIGAGLSGIRLLTEMTKGKVKDTAASSEVEKIYESVGDISAKMKEVIWSLNTENDQLSSLISYIQRQARSWLENYPCQLIITIPEKIPDMEINGEARRNIFLTVKEAVHNIIKHSGADKVIINIACNEQLIITISDNGKGMHVDENSNFGNGLKNMKQRIHQLNGRFFIQNHEGFTLKFEIPYQQVL